MEFYAWVVLLHIVGAFLFAIAHGGSVVMAFGIRSQREPARVTALLDASAWSFGAMYVGLLLLLVGGIAAGIMGGHFGRAWIWVSLGVLVLVVVAMYAMASRHYANVRSALGLPSMNDRKGAPPPPPAPPEELARLLDSRLPEVLLGLGGVGLLVILWLMVLKPF